MNDPAIEDSRTASPQAARANDYVGSGSIRTAVVVLISVALFLYAVRAILLPFVVAGAIAYVLTPVVNWTTSRTGVRRSLAAIIVFLVLVTIAGTLVELAAPTISGELASLAIDLEGTIRGVAQRLIGERPIYVLGRSIDASQIASEAVRMVRDLLGQDGGIMALTIWSSAVVFGTVLTIVILFYFLVSGPRIAAGLLWLVPPRHRPLAADLWSKLNPVLARYFIGVFIVAAYAIAAAYVGLGLVLGLSHAVVLAVLTGCLEMIPVVGPLLAATIAGLVAVHAASSLWNVAAFVLYAILLRLSIDQLLGPVVLGRAARAHPVLIIFCFLTGGLLFGVAGVIMAIPVALTARMALSTLYGEPLEPRK
jgi:predicted PurR-regulated permease PerM